MCVCGGGGDTNPPKISETTGRMTMKFLPDVKLLGMLTSRHFAGFSLLTLEINPENFGLIIRIKDLSVKYRTAYKM